MRRSWAGARISARPAWRWGRRPPRSRFANPCACQPDQPDEQAGRAGNRERVHDRQRTFRGTGRFLACAHLHAPPDDRRRGRRGLGTRGNRIRKQRGRDVHHVGAGCAFADVPRQRRLNVIGPSSGRDRFPHIGFVFTDRRPHSRPPDVWCSPRRRAAIRRRARNSSSLTLPVLSPSTSAISTCDEPCAYASHSSARSRGFRRPHRAPDVGAAFGVDGRVRRRGTLASWTPSSSTGWRCRACCRAPGWWRCDRGSCGGALRSRRRSFVLQQAVVGLLQQVVGELTVAADAREIAPQRRPRSGRRSRGTRPRPSPAPRLGFVGSRLQPPDVVRA